MEGDTVDVVALVGIAVSNTDDGADTFTVGIDEFLFLGILSGMADDNNEGANVKVAE